MTLTAGFGGDVAYFRVRVRAVVAAVLRLGRGAGARARDGRPVAARHRADGPRTPRAPRTVDRCKRQITTSLRMRVTLVLAFESCHLGRRVKELSKFFSRLRFKSALSTNVSLQHYYFYKIVPLSMANRPVTNQILDSGNA